MISLGLSLSEIFLVVGIDCRVLVNSSPSGSISLILACHAPSSFLGGLSQLIGFLIWSSDSHILLLRLMGMAPKNSTILLNTKDLVPSANPKIWSVSSNSPMLSFLKRYSGIMFTHDPRSTKVSKGFQSPNLQGRVNSLGLPSLQYFHRLDKDDVLSGREILAIEESIVGKNEQDKTGEQLSLRVPYCIARDGLILLGLEKYTPTSPSSVQWEEGVLSAKASRDFPLQY
ncbi:hypothetical protein Tco_0930339 [Tanacetum coccineum]